MAESTEKDNKKMKETETRNAICVRCKLKDSCKDIPGFCLLLPYFAVASVVLLILYFISNSSL